MDADMSSDYSQTQSNHQTKFKTKIKQHPANIEHYFQRTFHDAISTTIERLIRYSSCLYNRAHTRPILMPGTSACTLQMTVVRCEQENCRFSFVRHKFHQQIRFLAIRTLRRFRLFGAQNWVRHGRISRKSSEFDFFDPKERLLQPLLFCLWICFRNFVILRTFKNSSCSPSPPSRVSELELYGYKNPPPRPLLIL